MQRSADQRRNAVLRAVALGTAALAVLLVGAAFAVHLVARRRGLDVAPPLGSDVVLATLFPLAGALVLWRQPRNTVGWVLLSSALVAVSVLAHQWAETVIEQPGSLPFGEASFWFAAWTFAPYWAQPALLPVLFPDGRLPSPRWRRFVRVVAALLAVMTVTAMVSPNDDVSELGVANPLGLAFAPDSPVHVVWAPLQFVPVVLLWFVAAPVALAGMVARQRRATGRERAQLQWLLLGVVAMLVLTIGSTPLPKPVGDVLFAAGFACVPLAMVVAVLRHRMLDVELVVNRTIVYAGLTGLSVLAYLAFVALAGRWLSGSGAAPLAAGLVVALAAAGRSRLQQEVDRRLFGARSDPYALLQRVGASTAAADAPDAALAALVRTVREALRVPFVQVLDARGEPVAEVGEPVAGTHVVPVVDRGRRLGVLVVGRRSRRERLRPEELTALGDVAHRAGALLSARQLSGELQRSYAALVRVREEERRRLRRELHDGVGPALAGTALQLDSLASRLRDEELARRAERLRDRLQDTVGEVRRMVDGLRPAALDELGLPAALQALETDADDPVHVRVAADLPADLPAGVEAAAYRIAGEAVANALRHAGARSTTVTAHVVDDALHLVVADDGGGFGTDVTAGVGLESMHERAAEVGGVLSVHSTPGGTSVRAVLPLQERRS